MRLLELFDKPLPYTIEQHSQFDYEAFFDVGDTAYNVSMELYPVFEYITPKEVETSYESASKVFQHIIDNSTKDDWIMIVQFQDDEGNTNVTGKGNQFLVFGSVFHIITTVMNAREPKWLMMSAEEPNRARLYDRMIRRYVGNNILRYNSPYGEHNFMVQVR